MRVRGSVYPCPMLSTSVILVVIRRSLMPELTDFVKKNHPYDEPEVSLHGPLTCAYHTGNVTLYPQGCAIVWQPFN